MEKKDTLIYIHKKPCGTVFYVGIGNKKRPYVRTDRSVFWNRIVDRYGYNVEILKNNLTWSEACELEMALISYYGRRDLGEGQLVNLTSGGEGAKGAIRSESSKAKQSKSKSKKVDVHSVEGKYIGTYQNTLEAGKATGVHPSLVAQRCRGKYNESKGYVFSYKITSEELDEIERKYLDKNMKLTDREIYIINKDASIENDNDCSIDIYKNNNKVGQETYSYEPMQDSCFKIPKLDAHLIKEKSRFYELKKLINKKDKTKKDRDRIKLIMSEKN